MSARDFTAQRVLVTGGAGFIGRWVVARCVAAGADVTVVDNLCAGSRAHLEEFEDRIAFHEADIRDADALRAAFDAARPEVVFHLAAHHFIPFCNEHPRETLRVNVEGTYAVAAEAVRCGARTLVLASTGGLYPSMDAPLAVDLPAEPPDVYGLSKQLAEGVVAQAARTSPLAVVAARLFNTYGPWETNPHLIPHILECLQEGDVVPLGNIHTKRDYVYVEDVADLLVGAAAAAEPGYQVVNVGTGDEHSAEEIVHAIGRLTGREIDIRVDADRVRKVDKLHQRAGLEALETLVGARPRHALDDGLRRLLAHEGFELAAPAGA